VQLRYVPPKEMLKDSEGAAVLRLIEIRELSSGERELVYRVGRVVKGAPRLRRGRRIAIGTLGEVICGPIEQVGRLTGLFLGRRDGRWTGGACGEISAAQMRRLADRTASASGPGGCAGSTAGT
jgi:hypothetical protein